jgi:hypothetical protein
MQSKGFGRAIGMYSTAVSLTDGRSVIAIKCAKALEAARLAFEEDNLKKSEIEIVPEPEEERVRSPFEIAKWVFLGFCFVLFCIWGTILFLDTFFAQ